MKNETGRRSPSGFLDYLSLGITTFGVGYIPGAPGTYGSLIAVAFYAGLSAVFGSFRYTPSVTPPEFTVAAIHAVILIAFVLFILLGIWGSGRAMEILGDADPKQAVVDEVIGQLTVFLFIPFTRSWVLIAGGFILFRLFDIWKPYPIDHLQSLPGGIGVCADDVLAGIYAGVVLSVIHAGSLWV